MAKRPEASDQDKNLQQVPVRIHRNDYAAAKKLFIDEELSLQKFFTACMDEYLARNPLLLKVIGDWKTENVRPKKLQDKYTHSKREAAKLLDEIEESSDE